MAISDSNSISVLVIGPSPELIGGMSQMVAHNLSLDDPRVRISFLPLPLGSKHRKIGAGTFRHLLHTLQLFLLIHRQRVRIVHLHTCSRNTFWRNMIDMMAARACGCKIILHVHGGEFESFYSASNGIAQYLIRHCLELADAVIALSRGWRRTLQKIAPHANLRVIENAVKTSIERAAARPASCCRFLFLSKMDEAKGVFDAIEACRILANDGRSFHLTLAGPTGSAGDKDVLAARIDDANLKKFVEYVGSKTGDEKEHLFSECDVLLFPSWFEGMPITILEAMARSIPVIATDVGAIPEVITNGVCGILVPPRNAPALADAMRSLVENPALRAELASAGRQQAALQFSIPRFSRELIELYLELSFVSGFTDDAASTQPA